MTRRWRRTIAPDQQPHPVVPCGEALQRHPLHAGDNAAIINAPEMLFMYNRRGNIGTDAAGPNHMRFRNVSLASGPNRHAAGTAVTAEDIDNACGVGNDRG